MANFERPRTLTRTELHELVWTTPATKLAPQFGLSDVGLSKLCKRYEIPRPPRGFWARLQHGQSPEKTPLPESDVPDQITIRAHGARAPQVRRDDPDEPVIEVPDSLIDPHPVIAKTEKSIRAAPVQDGLLSPRAKGTLNVSVSPNSVDRAMLLLDTILKNLPAHSYELTVVDRAEKKDAYGRIEVAKSRHSYIVVDGELIQFSLVERINRKKRELTPAEERQKERRPWNFRHPRYDYIPTGRLILSIHEHQYGTTKPYWSDRGRFSKVEKKLGAFFLALARTASARKQRRAEAEAERLAREAKRAEREKKLQQIKLEDERVAKLLADSDSWHSSQRLRAFIAAKRGALAHGQPTDEELKWLDWASDQADRMDPLQDSPLSILDERAKWERPTYYW